MPNLQIATYGIKRPLHSQLPCRRFTDRGSATSLFAALAAFAASATGAVNFWFRFPDLHTFLRSPWLLAYVALSFLLGMAATYYWDTGRDQKLMNIICAGLRIVGGALVFYSLHQLWEVGLAAVGVLALVVALALPRALRAPRPLALENGAPDSKNVYVRLLCTPAVVLLHSHVISTFSDQPIADSTKS